jgi:F0F1-type ATP synthase epsilon subunit
MIEEKTEASEKVAAALEEKQAAANNGQPIMRVKVYSPFKVYYDEDSYSVSGENATGPFDILPHHHNFMTLIAPCVLLIKPVQGASRERKIRISGGLMHVKADKVTVFLDI